jgi:probable HAF family extracellular repeat protein
MTRYPTPRTGSSGKHDPSEVDRPPRRLRHFLTALAPTLLLLAATVCESAGSPSYHVAHVPQPAGSFNYNPTAINQHGHVVGWAQYSQAPTLRAWLWTPEDGLILLPAPPGETRYRATDINVFGVIAGDGGSDGGTAWRYENGTFTMLGSMPGLPISVAGGINNVNQVAGTAKDFSVLTPDRVFLHTDEGGMTNLTPDFGATGTGINNAGVVCGYSQSNNAFRWSDDGGIFFLPAPEGLPLTFAFAINDHGQIVGEAKSANGNIARAFIYSDAAGIQTLPPLASQLNRALGVNHSGHVVGYSDPPGSLLGWFWSPDEGLVILNDRIDAAEHLNIIRAIDINDTGQIVTKATDTKVGGQRLVVLSPIDAAIPGDLNGDGVVNVADLLILFDNWGDCDDCDDCPADLNGDCEVNVGDLLILFDNWG